MSATVPHCPIIVMSFDRPDYLAKVLASLRPQVPTDSNARAVVLFQDGVISPFSGRKNAAESAVQQCIEVFRRAFPHGLIKTSTVNLGVALNFDRAERFVFDELRAEAGLFLEDDLVLNRHYLATMDTLVEQFAHDERIGYVAAYGDHTKSLAQQQANSRKLILLGHNWGFALFRRQWLKMRGRVLEYLDVIKGCDYQDRDGDKITRLFNSWGYGDPAISQDAAKTIACCMDGVVKLNTYVCNATYIGARGVHMNEKIFAERGYSRTVVYPDPVLVFESVDDALYRRLLAEQRDWANSSRSPRSGAGGLRTVVRLPSLATESAGAGSGDGQIPPRPEEFVKAAYRSLLHRDPDASGLAAYCRQFSGRPVTEAIQRTITGIMKSKEFARKWEAARGRTREPVMLAVQRGLIGNVPSSLRGVALGWADNTWVVRFIVDGEILEDDHTCVKAVAGQVAEELGPSSSVRPELVRRDYPAELRTLALQDWAFMRREPRRQ